jgi:hypothetical protein
MKHPNSAIVFPDPNAHILWIENAKARLKALRNIEPGLVSYTFLRAHYFYYVVLISFKVWMPF